MQSADQMKGIDSMSRQTKYPDTDTFRFYNANPKGRYTTDCVARAISLAAETPYNQVVMELAELQCQTGYDKGDAKLYGMYLESKGWVKNKQPRKADNTKFTGKDFCRACNHTKRFVAHIGGGHVVAIVDGKVHDTWDSTGGCIGNYWSQP